MACGATLPFFIPFAYSDSERWARSFAFARPSARARDLFDIGIAGPIAGFVVAVIVLFLSLGLSQPAPDVESSEQIQLGYPLIFHRRARAARTLG